MELEQIFFPVAFFFLFGATLAFFLSTWLYGKKINKTEAKKDKLIEELATLKERADQNRDQEEILKKISSEIWNSHEKTFTEKNKINLNALLSPMQINLKTYKDDLDKQIRNFEKNRTEFSAQFDMFHKINATMREETTKLTNALT